MRINKSLTVISAIFGGSLALIFLEPLRRYFELATGSDLYSHTLLIPPLVIYLIVSNRKPNEEPSRPNPVYAVVPALLTLVFCAIFVSSDFDLTTIDGLESHVAYAMLTIVSAILTFTCLLASAATIRRNLFPLFLLLWTAPFPAEVKLAIQTFFQHVSADVAYWFIKVAGVPIYREELVFHMPTIVMEVAPQCSGLRSSLVLFIVSLVASYLFLETPWKRTVFVLLVIPIGILRNAIRILILALQCYHIGPEEIDGWFHRQGGQPLFAITLIPLFVTLFLFRRSEK